MASTSEGWPETDLQLKRCLKQLYVRLLPRDIYTTNLHFNVAILHFTRWPTRFFLPYIYIDLHISPF